MKKIKFFLPFAAVALLASCTDDKQDGPNSGLDGVNAAYFTVNITQKSATRTGADYDGSEEGDDARNENAINNVLLIIADKDGKFLAQSSKTLTSPNTSQSYTETFTVEGEGLTNLGSYTDNTVKVFVVCNKVDDDSFTLTKGDPVQQELTLSTDNGKYSTISPYFLMSNADESYSATLDVDGIKNGKYAEGKEVHSLGTVKVQRAVARFDLAKDEPTSTVKDQKIKLNFDGVALLNLNKKFYLFKEVTTGDNKSTSKETWTYFAPEDGANWVLDPTDKTITSDNKSTITYSNWFIYPANEKAVGELTYTEYDDIDTDDKLTSDSQTWPTGTTDTQKGREYKYWRYVTPNNVFGENNQMHGNTTGVAFRAEIQQGTATFTSTSWGTDDIYSYGDIIYGNFDDLKATAKNPGEDINAQAMAVAFNSTSHNGDEVTADDLENNASFKKFSPSDNKYYCYYYYWNRHNDNGVADTMGNMEFQVVRNNVYKLCVTKVTGLGVPGTDTPDPGTPDEEKTTEANFMVEVQVIPWSVRVNDIEF